jgi:GTP-binding protein
MFVDEVDVVATAGNGGRGCVSFRREKYVPRGGPDGGDGGAGGSVFIAANPQLNTLVKFRYHPEFKAQRGGHGQGSNRTGKSGRDLTIDVPIGTIVFAVDESGERTRLADLAHADDRALIARGGRGGRGNARFVSATNQAPRRADPGEEGETVRLHLRLKLLADVGLVGFPNAGKSTLISRISAARPKIADYPFTTLVPNLGVVDLGDDRSFVVADVPGLIEGAHTGHGLGHRFLGHVERTKVLVHLVDVSSASGRDPVEDFDIIQRELALYEVADGVGCFFPPDSEEQSTRPHLHRRTLADWPQIVAATKIDAVDDATRLTRLTDHVRAQGLECLPISAVTGEGLDALLERVWRIVSETRRNESSQATPPEPAAAG